MAKPIGVSALADKVRDRVDKARGLRAHREVSWVDPETYQAIVDAKAWIDEFICAPHQELGRPGDVCPYARTAHRRRKAAWAVAAEIRTNDRLRVTGVIVRETRRLMDRVDPDDSDHEFEHTNILFPNLFSPDAEVLDYVHRRLKTRMMRQGVMSAAFFPGYQKPGARNAEFKLYDAPVCVFVVRPMALHDVVFLSHNRDGFAEYDQRFGARYRAGKVPKEFGYREVYAEAVERFK